MKRICIEAREELYRIVAGMRGPGGPKLKDAPGRVLYSTPDDPGDEEGKSLFCADSSRRDAIFAL